VFGIEFITFKSVKLKFEEEKILLQRQTRTIENIYSKIRLIKCDSIEMIYEN